MPARQIPEEWHALARAVIDRRVGLGHKTLRAFADASGLSTKTLGEIEGAKRKSYDRATLAQVEQALRWPSGTIRGLLAANATQEALPASEKVPAHLTPQQLAGLDPIRPGVEFPPALSDFLFWLTDEHSPLTREQRGQVERTLNEYARTVAMLVRGNAVVVASDDAGKSEAITRVTSELIDPASVP